MSKAPDISTQKFGRLTAIERAGKNELGRTIWRCRCECGNEVLVTYSYLVHGHTRSCGCLSRETARRNFKDVTGQRFGKLVAIRRVENNPRGMAQFLCKCDCGNEAVVATSYLLSGATKSCGCLQRARKQEDLVGLTFGRLTVESFAGYKKINSGDTRPFWNCVCSCGNRKTVNGDWLKCGSVKSCGCLNVDRTKETHIKHGFAVRALKGKDETRIYRIWDHMKQRCFNPKASYYKIYGGRGITVCEEWLGENGFENFLEWSVNNGYANNLSIDRINPDGNYEPSNCRWANSLTQANNKRTSRLITYKGETATIAQIAKKYNVPDGIFRSRLRCGWSIDDIISIPPTYHDGKRKRAKTEQQKQEYQAEKQTQGVTEDGGDE